MGKLKIAGIAVAALTVVVLVAAIGINSVAGKRMAQMEVKLKTLHEEMKARDTARPPRGKAIPGNAWEDYEKAFADIEADKDAFKRVEEFARRDPKADRSKAEAVIAAHAAALDHLRRGVSRERGEYPAQWEQGGAMKIPGLLQAQR